MIACAETAQAGIEWVRMCMRARAPCAAHHARVSCICQGEGERACTCALQTYVPVPMLEIAKQYPPSSSRIFRFQLLEDSALAPTTHSEEVVCGCLSSWRACVSGVRTYAAKRHAPAYHGTVHVLRAGPQRRPLPPPPPAPCFRRRGRASAHAFICG